MLEIHERTNIPDSFQSSYDDSTPSRFAQIKDPKILCRYLEFLVDELLSGSTVTPLYSSTLWLYYLKFNKMDDQTVGRFLRADVVAAIKSGLIINGGNLMLKSCVPEGTRPSTKQVREVLAETYSKVSPKIEFLLTFFL